MRLHFLVIKLITISMFFSLSSCEKGEVTECECPNAKIDTVINTVIDDYYYVKYDITGNGRAGSFYNWTVTTPDGKYSNEDSQVRSSWIETYGPVDKGFACNVQIGGYYNGAPTIKIYVSKNEEPFALKVSETGSSASYIVDF